MSNIEPCPFCGGEKQSVIRKSVLAGWNGLDERVDYNRWYVRCNSCFARGGTAGGKILHSTHFDMKMPEWATTDDNLRDLAILNWNNRGGLTMFCDDMKATCKDCANVGECGVTKIGCAFYRSRENITEADRIRGMTDEELADWLLGASGCGPEWDHEYCRSRPHCGVNCWLDWLRKPVEKEDI